MGRCVLWALGIVLGFALSASPAAAQVDIGVWTPNGGGRVVVGAPPVYYPPPPVYAYPAPVYVDPYYYRPYYRYRPVPRGYGRGYVNFGRSYYGYPRYNQNRVYRGNAYGRSYYQDNRSYRGDRSYRGGGDRSRRRR
jgi:hypothetical protein